MRASRKTWDKNHEHQWDYMIAKCKLSYWEVFATEKVAKHNWLNSYNTHMFCFVLSISIHQKNPPLTKGVLTLKNVQFIGLFSIRINKPLKNCCV